MPKAKPKRFWVIVDKKGCVFTAGATATDAWALWFSSIRPAIEFGVWVKAMKKNFGYRAIRARLEE
jgi:hypothetical protein